MHKLFLAIKQTLACSKRKETIGAYALHPDAELVKKILHSILGGRRGCRGKAFAQLVLKIALETMGTHFLQ